MQNLDRAGGRLCVSHHIQHTSRQILVAQTTIWTEVCPRDFPADYGWHAGGHSRCHSHYGQHSDSSTYSENAEPVEKFSDASSSGLGAVLLQDNRPDAFSSRSLTDAETRYAQIEKEMLSIVHACTKFHHYILGKQVTVYNDHKPLEDIFKKSLLLTPMRLQWYDINVKYRRGKDMELPDTLSRAQLSCNTPELDGLECVAMLSYVSVSA